MLDSPYRLIEALGSCQAGSVWRAVDVQGVSVTVAVLDATVASDQQWRDAFAETADALAQPQAGGTRFARADFSAPVPWAAWLADGGPGAECVFQALGMDYRPVPPEEGNAAGPPVRPVHAGQPPAQAATSTDAGQESGPAEPAGQLDAGPRVAASPWADGPSKPAGGAAKPRRHRTGLWAGVAVLVLFVLAGGGTVVAVSGPRVGSALPDQVRVLPRVAGHQAH